MMTPIGYQVRALKRPKDEERWNFFGPGSEVRARKKARSLFTLRNHDIWTVKIVCLY